MTLSLRIVEQPARYHRFRYETEIAGGKLGGLLYGRSGSKSCVKLALSDVDTSICRSVIVIGGTISPDGYPHPFYMHGDLCESGAFQWRRDLTSGDANKTEIEISLDKVSLVCVPHGGSSGKLQKAIKRREDIQFNPYNKKISEKKYTSRNVRELRLVFQAYYVDFSGKTVACKSAIVQTDVIADTKFQTKLEIEDVNPSQGFVHAMDQEVWIVFKDGLPHLDIAQYNAFLYFENVQLVSCTVIWLKKQLMSISIPCLSDSVLSSVSHNSGRWECSLRIVDLKSDVFTEHEFYLSAKCTLCGSGRGTRDSLPDPPPKRSRKSANGSYPASSSASASAASHQDRAEQSSAVINLPVDDSHSLNSSSDDVKTE